MTMNNSNEIKNWYGTQLEEFLKSSNGSALSPLRKTAVSDYAGLSFPTTKEEDWRFTNIDPLLKTGFSPVKDTVSKLTKSKLAPFLFHKSDFATIVFVNGVFQKQLSKLDAGEGVVISTLEEALVAHPGHAQAYLGKLASSGKDIFNALNAGLLRDGIFILFKKNTIAEKPIHILHVIDSDKNVLAQPRLLIVGGDFSKGEIIESYESLTSTPYMTNSVAEIVLEENAFISHVKIQNESTSGFHVGTSDIGLKKASNYTSYNLNFGAKIARNNINAKFEQPGTECHLFGLYMGSGDQLIDNHTLIDHAQPLCNSNELYKGVLTGSARAVFNGKIIVRRDAQKTNAFQQNKNILLSEDALVDTKPQLEIFADDVKCSHGATVGQLDEEALFYLRSRGIGKDAARSIMVAAFAEDVVKNIRHKHVVEYLEEKIAQKLHT
jgi:Fe-S cluster assembly protein SufD